MLDKEQEDIQAVLDHAHRLEQHARTLDDGSESITEAVLLCAGKIQELTGPGSAHRLTVEHILGGSDVGSRDTLRRMRGVLRAVTLIDGVPPALRITST